MAHASPFYNPNGFIGTPTRWRRRSRATPTGREAFILRFAIFPPGDAALFVKRCCPASVIHTRLLRINTPKAGAAARNDVSQQKRRIHYENYQVETFLVKPRWLS